MAAHFTATAPAAIRDTAETASAKVITAGNYLPVLGLYLSPGLPPVVPVVPPVVGLEEEVPEEEASSEEEEEAVTSSSTSEVT